MALLFGPDLHLMPRELSRLLLDKNEMFLALQKHRPLGHAGGKGFLRTWQGEIHEHFRLQEASGIADCTADLDGSGGRVDKLRNNCNGAGKDLVGECTSGKGEVLPRLQ